jgi:DNA polymerase-3 subunit epsilon
MQLGMIFEVDGVIKKEHNFFMRPLDMAKIDSSALETTGLTLEQIAAFPEQKDVFPQIVAALDAMVDKYDRNDKLVVCGYNCRFDLGFLSELFKKNENFYLGSYISWKDVDILYLMYIHDFLGTHKLANYRLKTVAETYGYIFKAHDALEDARATRFLMHRFLMPHRRA